MKPVIMGLCAIVNLVACAVPTPPAAPTPSVPIEILTSAATPTIARATLASSPTRAVAPSAAATRGITQSLATAASSIAGLPNGARVERVTSADFAVTLAFAPDGRVFFAEKNSGNLRVIENGRLVSEPVVHLDSEPTGERGLLGIALDPNFAANNVVWLFHTLRANPTDDEIVRVTLSGNRAVKTESVYRLPNPGAAVNHNGGVIAFGPDGMLYVVIGEHSIIALAQDLSKAPGKLHRFAPGAPLAPAPGNPFGNSSVYAYGIRNSFGFDFDPLGGKIFMTINGPACDDFVVLVLPGSNHGWRPATPCGDENRQYWKPLLPLLRFSKPIAPTQLTFYRGRMFPEWQNDLFFCAANDQTMRHVKLNAARDNFESVETFPRASVPCMLDVKTGTDGALWFTDNRAIYRIVR